jgi:transposase
MTSTNRIDRQEFQDRRLRAAELLAAGVRQAEVARQFGVSRQSVNRWHARFKHDGAQALQSRGPTGYPGRLSDQDLHRLTELLLQGAAAHGFTR